MQVIYPACAGLDVHKKTVVVTTMLTQPDGSAQKRTRTFGTMTADLLALDDWLKQQAIQVIALESTGVYWHPVYNIRDRWTHCDPGQPATYESGAWSQDGY